MNKLNGCEYEVVGYCSKCNRMIVAPIVWSTRKYQRPEYPTCSCRSTSIRK